MCLFQKNKNVDLEFLIPKPNRSLLLRLFFRSKAKNILRISLREWEVRGAHYSAITILTLFSKAPFLPLIPWDLWEKLRRNKGCYHHVSHWTGHSLTRTTLLPWLINKMLITFKAGFKFKKGHWPKGRKEDVLTLTEAIITDQLSNNMNGRRRFRL